jgi:NADH-quinone oxidoreductase subunit I
MYGLGIARGMFITFKHLFQKPITVQYPEEVRLVPQRARTNLLWFEERCTGCSTCAQACPDGCILVHTSPAEDLSLNVERYEIDFRLCMYCGLCVEACPYEAIQAGGPMNDAAFVFDDLYRDKHRLTALSRVYLEEHEFVYPNGRKAPPREGQSTYHPEGDSTLRPTPETN